MSITRPHGHRLREPLQPLAAPALDTPAPRSPLAGILPAWVEFQEHFGEPPGGALFPEERRVVTRAIEARTREFATVRACARVCLSRLGHPPVPILPGPTGAPVWPHGVRGSMTHCEGYAAAAVGLSPPVHAVGIDAEPDAPLPDGVLDVVATPAELALIHGIAALEEGPCWDRLLFSAKESVYKTWCPVMGTWLDPQESEIVFHPGCATFTAVLSRPCTPAGGRPVARLEGRWARQQGLLLTALVLAE
jgi:4'-phosphopantetheinyl transferase EntD